MEYWVEENIKPNSPQDMDSVLLQHIKRIVDDLKRMKWVVSWHFLRESANWRGQTNVRVPHIRFRVRTQQRQTKLLNLRSYLTNELNRLQNAGEISDHYRGNHGTPGQEYQGESGNFDEAGPNPKGWKVTQKWLESGSEVALNLMRTRLAGVRFGPRFIMEDLLHFISNQNGYRHGYNPATRQFIIWI